MRIAVYGCSDRGIMVMQNLIEKKDIEYSVFIDNNIKKIGTSINDIDVVSLYSFLNLYHQGKIDRVVIPNYSISVINSMKTDLRKNGVKTEDVLIIDSDRFIEAIKDLDNYAEYKFTKIPYVQYMSFEAFEKCNLNCKRCDHFSNITLRDEHEGIDEFENTVRLLSAKIERIGCFSFLGGEPLLNMDLYKYLYILKRYYPDTQIIILTNGLLLRQMPEELIKAILATKAIVRMTLYPPLKSEIDNIIEYMRNRGIQFELSKVVDEFWTQINIRGDSNPHKMLNKCVNSDCFIVKRGKISKCPISMNIQRFNDYFGTKVPQDVLDLASPDITIEDIHRYLFEPIKTCEYCGEERYYEWERTTEKIKICEMLCWNKV